MSYITMDDISYNDTLKRIQSFVDDLDHFFTIQHRDSANVFQTYLQLHGDDQCEYYMVNNTENLHWVFWLDDFADFKTRIYTIEDMSEVISLA